MPKRKVKTKKINRPNSHAQKKTPKGPHHIFFYVVVFIVVFIITFVIFSSFDFAKDESIKTTTNPISGTYEGTTPCADCSGIDTTLILNSDSDGDPTSYSLKLNYNGKDVNFSETGKWTITNSNGEKIITLVPNEGSQVTYYRIIDNTKIRQLDSERKPLPENLPFTLTKN